MFIEIQALTKIHFSKMCLLKGDCKKHFVSKCSVFSIHKSNFLPTVTSKEEDIAVFGFLLPSLIKASS